MLGAAVAKLYAKVRAGEGDAALAKARSNACSSDIPGGLLREPEAAAHHLPSSKHCLGQSAISVANGGYRATMIMSATAVCGTG
jgi:hypothetical protein